MDDKIIIGQEAVCPDGLGRVKKFNFEAPYRSITVTTYFNNRDCDWDVDNVFLVPLSEPKKEIVFGSLDIPEEDTKAAIENDIYALAADPEIIAILLRILEVKNG